MFSKTLIFLLLTSVISTGTLAAGESCQDCHGNFQLMSSLGRSDIAFSANEIQSQIRMDAACSQCHLGRPAEKEKTAAHTGYSEILGIKFKGVLFTRLQKQEKIGIEACPV